MALISPKDSWKAAASWLAAPQSCGFIAQYGVAHLVTDDSGLSPEYTMPDGAGP
jgi:hypothetical protein